MATPNLTEIATTTLRNRTGKLADNVTRNNALLRRLSAKGKIRPVDGGRTIIQELEWDNNLTYKRYAGYELLNISPSEVFSAAEFNYAQSAVAISISGLEQLQNSGKEAIINLLESRIGNGERTFRNMLSYDLYSDGTADGSKQIGGLALLVAADPTTGTVGGIDRSNASFAFWRNIRYRCVTDGGAAMTAANIQRYMNSLWVQLVRGPDRPDLIIADNTAWRVYLESLQAIQRIQTENTGQVGFQSLKYMDADVVLDGGFQGVSGAPSGYSTGGVASVSSSTMFFLNTDYIHFRPHKDRNMVPLDPERFAVNQDAMVKLLGFAGNMTLSNAFLQGVLNNT